MESDGKRTIIYIYIYLEERGSQEKGTVSVTNDAWIDVILKS